MDPITNPNLHFYLLQFSLIIFFFVVVDPAHSKCVPSVKLPPVSSPVQSPSPSPPSLTPQNSSPSSISRDSVETDSPDLLVQDSPESFVQHSPGKDSTDAPVADSPQALDMDSPVSFVQNSPVTNSPDAPVADSPEALDQGSPVSFVQNSPDAPVADSPDALVQDSPESFVQHSPNAVVTDSLDAVVTDSPDAVVTDSPDAQVTDSPDAQVTDSPDALLTDSPDALVQDSPKGGTSENPGEILSTKQTTGLPFQPHSVLFPSISKILKPDPAVEKICEQTDYPDLCRASISPFFNGKTDVISLLEISIKACAQYAKVAIAAAKQLVNAPTMPKATATALGDCTDMFSDALDNLQSAMDAMATRDIPTINTMLSAAISDFSTCEDEFEGERSLLVSYDTKLSNMATNCLAVASLIGK